MKTNEPKTHEQPNTSAYAHPEVVDYGTLLDLTQNGGQPNADLPGGPANTANSVGI